MSTTPQSPKFECVVADDPTTVLFAERLRDGRIALGTRVRKGEGEWRAGEVHFLDPAVQLDLSAWLTAAVEAGWIDTVRERQAEPLRTAGELYGEGPGALQQLALETLAEIPAPLLVRALVLLANSVGPQARSRLIERLNDTPDWLEDEELRRRMAEENEAFGYAIAAAGLFDALSRGIYPEDMP